jgi:hypothetical protein
MDGSVGDTVQRVGSTYRRPLDGATAGPAERDFLKEAQQ